MKGTEPMKGINLMAAAGALFWLTGCASAPDFAIVRPVGPAPGSPAVASKQGYVVVYTARQQEPITANFTEWQREYNLGRYPVAYELAHTAYTIRREDGRIIEHVRNAKGPDDPQPKVVALPPGRYQVEAEAQEPNGQMVSVILPVVVEPGKTTVAHLADQWKPGTQFREADVVRLPDGQIAGWMAQE